MVREYQLVLFEEMLKICKFTSFVAFCRRWNASMKVSLIIWVNITHFSVVPSLSHLQTIINCIFTAVQK